MATLNTATTKEKNEFMYLYSKLDEKGKNRAAAVINIFSEGGTKADKLQKKIERLAKERESGSLTKKQWLRKIDVALFGGPLD